MRLWRTACWLGLMAVGSVHAADAVPLDGRMIEHMQFAGYQDEPTQQPDVRRFVHKKRMNLSVRQRVDGLMFYAWYRATPHLRSHRAECLAAFNDANAKFIAMRMYIDADEDVAIEAFYPGVYQKTNFSEFLDTLAGDETTAFGDDLGDRLEACIK